MLDMVCPTWWYTDITLDIVALDTPQMLAFLVTDEPERHNNNLSSFELRHNVVYVLLLCI